ncbi:MAG: hypothetical protein N3G22_03020 [Candidatus Micrarchaeota archaeon]|nr:hypothetical protein [Candidatus Micrarchaeota archaeon]
MAEKKGVAGERDKQGICVLCGSVGEGVPAAPDFAISSARKIRKLLGMEERHTIACEKCLQACIQKREKFERMNRNYRIYAALFFLLVFGGSTALRGFDARILLPALLGCAIILLLPYGHYSPKFESGKKSGKNSQEL